MSEKKLSTSINKGTRSNSRKVKDKDKDLIQDTSVSYPYLCDICKGNDTLRSVLHNDEVKTFISKISDLTQANDKLSDQISILKNMDLHIQHILLIDPKQLVHNNVKLTKLDLQFTMDTIELGVICLANVMKYLKINTHVTK